MGSESIAHEPEGRIGYWLRGHEGERNNCFSKIQLVGQNYWDKTTLASYWVQNMSLVTSQTKANCFKWIWKNLENFTCTIVSITFVPWLTGASEWSLSVITPSVFMTAIISSVALIYVWRINPVNLKVLARENININTSKLHYLSYQRNSTTKCSSDYWKNIQALLMLQYWWNTLLFWKLAANLLCINKRTAYI